jgi:nitrate/nitrite transporter NarK
MLVSTLYAELFGVKSHGLMLGVSSLIGALGGAFGPFIAGYIFDTRGSYELAFLMCGILVVAGLIMAIFLRPSTKKARSSSSPS